MTEYTIRVDYDEGGFHLVVEVPNFEGELDLVRYRIADPEALYTAVKAEIGPWLYERDQGRLAFLCVPDESAGMREAYATDDPKHPDFHSVHVDLWDARGGK